MVIDVVGNILNVIVEVMVLFKFKVGVEVIGEASLGQVDGCVVVSVIGGNEGY